MPLYEFRCRSCGATFDALRAIDAADEPAACPAGHDDTVRLLSMVAPAAKTSSSGAPAPSGGGCGGGCACACGG